MNQSQNNMMLFGCMAGLLALVGIGQGWDVALLLLLPPVGRDTDVLRVALEEGGDRLLRALGLRDVRVAGEALLVTASVPHLGEEVHRKGHF